MAFLDEMLNGFGDIFAAPFKSLDALWILVPLFILWITLEIYFARFKKEKLGWNTALANGITLGWLTLQGMKALFEAKPGNFLFRFIANFVIILYALMIIYGSFTHKISSKWDFLLASPTPVYFLGVFSVMWGFGTLEITGYVLLDLLILFIVIIILLAILRKMVKPAKEEEEEKPPEMPEMPKEEGLPSLEGGAPPLAEPGKGLPPLGGKDEFPSLDEKLPPLGGV
jgi:preprotein translocase subunit SecG